MQELEKLRSRLERALAGRSIEQVFPTPKAIVPLAAPRVSLEQHLAQSAMRKLQAGEPLFQAEVEALELTLCLARPALRLDKQRPEPHALRLQPEVHARVEEVLEGVAAIADESQVLATGFQVGRRVLATNRHVAAHLEQQGHALAEGAFVVRFSADGRSRHVHSIPVLRVIHSHPTEDVALLELAEDGPLAQGLPLARAPGLQEGQAILVVGYPTSALSTPYFVEAIFGRDFAVRRASPGEVLSVQGLQLRHDCSTLCGSSGSPILDCRTGHVVGIHASGRFAYHNTGVCSAALHAEAPLRQLVSSWV